MESLRHDIKGCEKNKMQNNPGYHTLEYIEDKFEKKTRITP